MWQIIKILYRIASNFNSSTHEVTKLFFDPVNNQISEADQLNLQKILTYQNHQISFRNKIYLRRISFSKRLKEKAIDFCRDCQKSNLGSFLVEETNYFTVWIENSMLDLA